MTYFRFPRLLGMRRSHWKQRRRRRPWMEPCWWKWLTLTQKHVLTSRTSCRNHYVTHCNMTSLKPVVRWTWQTGRQHNKRHPLYSNKRLASLFDLTLENHHSWAWQQSSISANFSLSKLMDTNTCYMTPRFVSECLLFVPCAQRLNVLLTIPK
jgi:hypothetical protein